MIRSIVRVSVCGALMALAAVGLGAQGKGKKQVCRGFCVGQVISKDAAHGHGMHVNDGLATDDNGIIVWTLQRLAGLETTVEITDFTPSCPGDFYVDGTPPDKPCDVIVHWDQNDADWRTVRFEAAKTATGNYGFTIYLKNKIDDPSPKPIKDPEIEIDTRFKLLPNVLMILLAAVAGFVGVALGLRLNRQT